MSSRLRVLIVDDSELARQRLEELLIQSGRCEIIGADSAGEAAVEDITRLQPDLVFLDIQMGGLSGIEVMQELGAENMPPTIFVTAYSEHAVRAFELGAIDYLLKPFEDERFELALDRAEQRHRLGKLGNVVQPLNELLDRLQDAVPPPKPAPASAYIARFAVESGGEMRIVPVEEVQHISAGGHYIVLHSGPKTYVIRERMDALEHRLDPARFFRVHRSAIVQLKHIHSLVREAGGDYSIKLESGAVLPVGRSRIGALVHWMGIAVQH